MDIRLFGMMFGVPLVGSEGDQSSVGVLLLHVVDVSPRSEAARCCACLGRPDPMQVRGCVMLAPLILGVALIESAVIYRQTSAAVLAAS